MFTIPSYGWFIGFGSHYWKWGQWWKLRFLTGFWRHLRQPKVSGGSWLGCGSAPEIPYENGVKIQGEHCQCPAKVWIPGWFSESGNSPSRQKIPNTKPPTCCLAIPGGLREATTVEWQLLHPSSGYKHESVMYTSQFYEGKKNGSADEYAPICHLFWWHPMMPGFSKLSATLVQGSDWWWCSRPKRTPSPDGECKPSPSPIIQHAFNDGPQSAGFEHLRTWKAHILGGSFHFEASLLVGENHWTLTGFMGTFL